MSESEVPPEGPPPPSGDDDFPEVRRRLWDLEWRLRRESGSVSDKLAEVLKLVFQAPAWTGEAVAEGMMPALADLRRRLIALETKATEGTAPQHPAFVALSERVDILERLVEEGVAAQREAITAIDGRLAGLEERIEEIDGWGPRLETLETKTLEGAQQVGDLSAVMAKIKELLLAQSRAAEGLGGRVEAAEQRIVAAAAEAEGLASRLDEAFGQIEDAAARLAEESAERLEAFASLRELAEATSVEATELGDRTASLEHRGEAWDLTLEETAGDLTLRVGSLESGQERMSRDLAEKVSSAQFAGVSLAMGTQQAAIKDIKAQITAIRAGGQLPPMAPEDLAALQAVQAGNAAASVDAEQIQSLWDHLGRLEERIAGMMPEFDRLSKDVGESRKGIKSLLANWMELENKLGFYAEKRQLQQLEARIPSQRIAEQLAGLAATEKRIADLETLAVGLQEGLREIAAALTGAPGPTSWEDLPDG